MAGGGFRRLAAIGQKRQAPTTVSGSDNPEEHGVWLLMRRLGKENQGFLWAVAQDFRPGGSFSLDDMASAAGISKSSAHARLMNIGRSMKSLGPQAPRLWDVSWEETENSYEWDFDAHRALLKLGRQ